MKRIWLFGLIIIIFGFATAPLAKAEFSTNLIYGLENSAAVKELQSLLTGEGLYNGPLTGNYYGLTRQAVRNFQIKYGLTPTDGRFNFQTRAKANEILKRLVAQNDVLARIEALKAEVERLQALLKEKEAQDARDLKSVSIEPQTIVGLSCYYRYLPTGRLLNAGKASGVIISKDGLILTARHLVDLKYSHEVDPESVDGLLANNSELDHCRVGQVPAGTNLPSAEAIRNLNPTILVPALPFTATLVYAPTSANLGLSELEASNLDFAVLKINGLSPEAGAWGVRELPASFPAANLLINRQPKTGDEVLTYGYPGELSGSGVPFNTFRLTGGAGKIKAIRGGDQKYLNKPLVINTELEVKEGRSGSPLFYKGYVAGIITAHSLSSVSDSYSVSMEAVYPYLQDVFGL